MGDLPILDRARLDLVTRGNVALGGEFLEALFDEATDLIARLAGAIAAGDRIAVADVAHTIKGNATELGAMRLRAAAAALEAESDAAVWPALAERLRTALTELQEFA